MIIKAPSVQPNFPVSDKQQNHRKPQVVRALQWFWRFSQFYGEYTVRSPQTRQQWARQQWLAEQGDANSIQHHGCLDA